jgi:hypothetical protein
MADPLNPHPVSTARAIPTRITIKGNLNREAVGTNREAVGTACRAK